MKIKYAIIPKLNTLSAKEMDLFLFMVKRQDQYTGCVEGIYYREAMKVTGMCKQSFYNALKGLEKKGIITVTKVSDMDYDICILGNAFPNREAWKEGYVKLNRKAFRSKAFWALKAHEKYLLLEFLKGTHENGHSIRIGVDMLYEKYKKILGVSKRVLRSYLHNLRKFFSIGIKDGKYYITYLHSVFETERGAKSEERQHWEHLVRKECWRNHVPEEEKNIEDTAELVHQYRQNLEDGTIGMLRILMRCIGRSVEGIERKKRKLNAKYVHKLVRWELFEEDPEAV